MTIRSKKKCSMSMVAFSRVADFRSESPMARLV